MPALNASACLMAVATMWSWARLMIFLLVYVPLTPVISFVDNEEHQWASDLVDALWGELMKPY